MDRLDFEKYQGGSTLKLHSGLPALAAGAIVVLALMSEVAADEVGHVCRLNCDGDPPPTIYYPPPPPPPPDPRQVQADQLFELGAEAWQRHDWETAATYYREAAETGGNRWPSASAAWSNYYKAMSNLYDDRASVAWDRRDWARAIDLYTQSLGFYDSDATRSNLRKAQGLQSNDWALAAYNRGNLDEAIIYWRQAYDFSGNPSYLDSLRKAEKKKLDDRVSALLSTSRDAYYAGNLADAEAQAREVLRLQPGSQSALELLADIEVRRGRPANGSLDDKIAAQDRAISALLKLRAGGADRQWFEATAHNGTFATAQELMRSARNNAEREKIAAAYTRWTSTLGQSGTTVTSDLRSMTSNQFFGMSSAGETVTATVPSAPPPNVPNARGPASSRAAPPPRPSPTAVAATDLLNQAIDHTKSVLESSDEPAFGVCFDNNCGGIRVTRFQKSTHDLFLPPGEETKEMKEIHATIVDLRKKLSEVQQQADPSQRATSQAELTRKIEDQGKRYEAEEKKKVSHGIAPGEVQR